MTATKTVQGSFTEKAIEYRSCPASVSMADPWYDIATIDHFWIKRRFEVLQQMAGSLIRDARQLAEVGCGNGLLQREVEDNYGREVMGFDLNEYALKRNVSKRSPVCCYDILQTDAALASRFDLIFLFDVLEHVSDQNGFLKAVLFHLAPSGQVLLNVPAGQWAFSAYDKAVGHKRRYAINDLRKISQECGLFVHGWTYWGLPLLPTLFLRKLWLMGKQSEGEIISAGMDSRTPGFNKVFGLMARCEWIPQKVVGTSLMAVLNRKPLESRNC